MSARRDPGAASQKYAFSMRSVVSHSIRGHLNTAAPGTPRTPGTPGSPTPPPRGAATWRDHSTTEAFSSALAGFSGYSTQRWSREARSWKGIPFAARTLARTTARAWQSPSPRARARPGSGTAQGTPSVSQGTA
jgi:hypothetical protein